MPEKQTNQPKTCQQCNARKATHMQGTLCNWCYRQNVKSGAILPCRRVDPAIRLEKNSATFDRGLLLVTRVYDVSREEVLSYSRASTGAVARSMLCLFCHEAGMSNEETASFTCRTRAAVKTLCHTALRRVGNVSAREYLAERVPVVTTKTKAKELRVPEAHVDRIVQDMKLGMSAYETVSYWPFPCQVSVRTVEAVRAHGAWL